MYVLMILQKLEVIRRLERGKTWRKVTPSYEVRLKRKETDFIKCNC
jgi:hypothetical protein